MYNFPDNPIPLLFPVSEGALLQPWFSLERLDQGLQLIRERKIRDFHCIRNATGALVNGEAPVMLQFEANTKLHQGFAIKNSHCSLCRRKNEREGCVHAAALAILSLTHPAPGARAVPVPLGFGGSDWLKLGTFLFDWLNRVKTDIRQTEAGGQTLLEIAAVEGLVRVVVPSTLADRGKFLLSRRGAGVPAAPKALALLDGQMQLLVMTAGETALATTGNTGLGWQRDSSFWLWLTRMLYILHGDILPALQWNGAASRFFLQLGSDREIGWLTVDLPPEKTWELVKKIALPAAPAILPPAEECYRLFFNADDRLEVSPSLRLADGRLLSRQELADRRFSAVYFLEGEGFLPVNRLAPEGVFKDPAAARGADLPLLGFLQHEKTKERPFTVAADDIPAFLTANRSAVRFPGNIVQPEVRDLQVVEFPDRLLIDDFEEEHGWCYLSCRYGLGNTSVKLTDIAAARKDKLSCLPGRQWLKLDNTPLSWLYDLPEDRFATDGSGRIRLSYREMLQLAALVPQIETPEQDRSLPQKLSGLLDVAGWTETWPPGTIPAHLRPYQRNGLAWLARLDRLGIGGLLADDMGLGKTHQGLALLQNAAQQEARNGRNLVICPASVLLTWAEKIDTFYPGMDYAVYYGPQRDLQAALRHRLLLTTYGIVRQDRDLLRPHAFDIVLLDEIQHLKNHTTATHRTVRDLNGRIKIGLTGTPVENSLQDLRALFDICLPGLLGSERQFERLYAQPISEGKNKEVHDRLSRLIHPFILRRSRSQVLTELPPVIDDDRLCELSDDQIALYREVIDDSAGEVAELTEGTSAIPYMNILAAITRLKQICCHPCLVQGCDDPGEYQSGKWDLFVELVEELLAADMKFVVFSQYTAMLDLIETHLTRLGIPFGILKGDMPPGKRQKMIQRFNTDPDCRVFCSSLLAGGVGIDLTAARAVIHYDRWWNPAREEQATARVHRMGQKGVVQVFRLITKGTLEEKIHRLITAKRELAASLIHEDEAGVIKQLDRRQLAELLRL